MLCLGSGAIMLVRAGCKPFRLWDPDWRLIPLPPPPQQKTPECPYPQPGFPFLQASELDTPEEILWCIKFWNTGVSPFLRRLNVQTPAHQKTLFRRTRFQRTNNTIAKQLGKIYVDPEPALRNGFFQSKPPPPIK